MLSLTSREDLATLSKGPLKTAVLPLCYWQTAGAMAPSDAQAEFWLGAALVSNMSEC